MVVLLIPLLLFMPVDSLQVSDTYKTHSITRRDVETPKGVTLAFVFDSTGSMSDELKQVKEGTQAIFKTMFEHPDKPIYNYALVPFNDPKIGPVTITTDPVTFNNSLKAITVDGGGDCPELAMGGIKLAVENSILGSYIYVFTDASAKDYHLRSEVEALIQRQQTQVVFVLTGICAGQNDPGYQAYESIATISAGQVFNIKKDEVNKVLKYVKHSVQERNKVVLVTVDEPDSGSSTFGVPVDKSMDVLTVSLTGKDPRLEVKDPHGKKRDGDKILTVPEAIVVSYPHPEPGNWSISTSSSSAHHIRVTSASEFSFSYGFSTNPTENIAETAPRPLIGVNTALLVKVTNQTELSHLTKLRVKDHRGTVLLESNLRQIPGQPDFYTLDMFKPPSSLFYLEVYGVDKTGMDIHRMSPTAISPQPPAPPIITMPPAVTAIKNNFFTLKCHVESLVPFTASWYKDGWILTPEETFKQSAEISLPLLKPNETSEGTYVCQAKNAAGTSTKGTRLTITPPPPKVQIPERVRVFPGKQGVVPCSVESELDYTVSWSRVPDSGGAVSPVSDARFQTVKTNGSLIINPVAAGDEGWYQCMAESTVGKGEGRVFVDVQEPIHVTVSPAKKSFTTGTYIKLSCRATGPPGLSLVWMKDGHALENTDRRLHISPGYALDLVLESSNREDEGKYECEASNEEEKDIGVSNLEYREKPSAVALEKFILALSGTRVHMQCNVMGVPKPEVTWFKDGGLISSGKDFTVLTNGSLLVESVVMDRAGDFECVAKNSVGEASDTITLDVGTKLQVVEAPRDVGVDINTDSAIPCNVTGIPTPLVKWRREDGKKMDLDRFSYTNDDCKLNIEAATLEDEGIYVATIQNDFGREEFEANITITGIVSPTLDMSGDLNVSTTTGSWNELKCTVVLGNPPPLITWYKDSEKLEEDQLKEEGAEVHKNGSLIFPYITLKNGGTYECEASNVGGTARKPMQMNILEPPIFSNPKRTIVKVRKGKDVQLPCVVLGKPKPIVTWNKNGAPLSPSSSIGRSMKDDSLLIKKANETNNGTYECIAMNSAGTQQKILDLLVEDPPKILPFLEEVYPMINEEIFLECNVTAYPPAELMWLKDGVPLSPEFVTYSEDNSSVSFTGNTSFSGQYVCIATNDAGSDNIIINVTVMEPPKFEPSEELITASAGEDITLHCFVDVFPPAEYFWSSSDITLDDEVFSSTLTLHNVQSKTTGVYLCEATNYAGSDQKVFYVKINVPPKIDEGFPEKEFLTQGSEYTLPCTAEGTPPPTITWKKVGEELPPSELDDIGVLKIKSATREHAGLYTCIAANSEGSDHKNVLLDVLVPPVLGELDTSVVEVIENKTILISCPAIEANPPPIINWLQNGRYLSASKRTRDGGKSLRLRKVTVRDAGVYSCVASNAAGRSKADITVKVLSPPKFTISSPILLLSEVEGSSITLDCSNSGTPQPKISWKRNGHVLLDAINPSIIRSPNEDVIQIPNAKVDDSGNYTCVGENKAGRVERTFVLEVYGNLLEYRGYTEHTSDSVWSSWSAWSSCSAACGPSEQVRMRKCMDEIVGCKGHREEWRRCITAPCSVNGGWNKWTPWSGCSVTCGSGKRYRYRKCDNPAPVGKGDICAGSIGQNEKCNPTPCQVDGEWSEWSSWGACGGPCSNSTRRRTRQCTEPAPAFGGLDCSGDHVEYTPCIQTGCPVDGQWSDWSVWTPCTATCGPSIRQREHSCTNPEPKFGGSDCSGDNTEKDACDTSVCDGIPLSASIRVKGYLNEQNISSTINGVKVTDSESLRGVEVSARNILKRQVGWFPFLPLILSPIIWSTAFQKEGASNGHTLSQSHFNQTMNVHFDTGETLVVTHTARGVESDGTLRMYVNMNGKVPLFPFDSSVKVEPYEEDYIQTGPDELFAASKTLLDANGLVINYSWNKTIMYDSRIMMPHFVQTLSVWDVKEHYHSPTRKMSHKSSAAIRMKRESDDCLEGFVLSSDGMYCQDVNECAETRLNHCHFTQICENHMGSYQCVCSAGMESSGIGIPCTDVDECALLPPICSHHCLNTEGSFKCLCPPGLDLLDSNVTCKATFMTDASLKGDSREMADITISCPPGFKEIEGVCQETNPCEGGSIMCTDNEICLNMHGLYRCVPVPCPSGYTWSRDTKNCMILCNEPEEVCDSGATETQTLKHIVLTPEGNNVQAYKDLTILPVRGDDRKPLPNTSFRIVENEEGKPFRVKMLHDDGVLYSMKKLPAGRNYRIIIVAQSYDDSKTILLHSTKFIILIRLSDEDISW